MRISLNHESGIQTSVERVSKMKLTCTDCFKTFKSQLALKYHKKKHARPRVCNICKCRFTSKDEVELHLEKHKLNAKVHEKFKEGSLYIGSGVKDKEKTEKTTDKSVLQDDSCDVTHLQGTGTTFEESPNSSTYKANKRTAKSKREIQTSDVIDHKVKQSPTQSKSTESSFTANNKNTSQNCDLKKSNRARNSKSDSDALENEVKSGGYVCGICDKSFCSRSILAGHVCEIEPSETRTSDVVKERRAKNKFKQTCRVCKKTYCTVTSFIRHSCKPKREMIKRKTCNFCEKSFKTHEHFKQHIRSHTGERPYLCGSCGKSFSQQGNLIKHMRIHSGDKMFLCEICSRPFMTKCALNEHIRVHSDQKQFQCDVCQKFFRHKHGLDNHQRKRKYPCNVRKYGENKSTVKQKKIRISTANEEYENCSNIGTKCSVYNTDACLHNALDLEAVIETKTAGLQENHVQTENMKDENSDEFSKSSAQKKNNFKPSLLNNIFSVEHSMQRIQNLTETMLPRLQSVNTIETYDRDCSKSLIDESQAYSLNKSDRNFTTDMEIHAPTTIQRNLTVGTNQCTTEIEMVKKRHIDKILMQYYNVEINPVQFNECTFIDTTDLKTQNSDVGKEGANMQGSFKTQNPVLLENLSECQTQKIIEPHNYEYSYNSSGVNKMKTDAVAIRNHMEESVMIVSQNQTKLATHPKVNLSLCAVEHEENTTTEVVLQSTGQSQQNEIFEKNRFFIGADINDDVSGVESEDMEVPMETLFNQQYDSCARKKKVETEKMVPYINNPAYDKDKCINVSETSSVCQASSKNHLSASLSDCKPAVKMSEEEILKVIEKARCKEFKCEKCDRSFSNEYCMSIHSCKSKDSKLLNTELEKTRTRKLCNVCGRSYANKYLLAYHSCRPIVKKAEQNRIYKTKQKLESLKSKKAGGGNKDFARNTNQRSTKVTLQTGIERKKVSSRLLDHEDTRCKPEQEQRKENVNTTKPEFEIELDIDQGDETKYKPKKSVLRSHGSIVCSICGKTYKNNTNLKKHSCKPVPEEPRTCKFCGKVFKLTAHLRIHLRIHTGELPFLCKVCGKQFNQGANLMKHLRIHSPEKLFKCEICDREFTQKGALTDHRIVHTNIKPYVCLKCNKSFRHKHGLQNHLKRKFPCDQKGKENRKETKYKGFETNKIIHGGGSVTFRNESSSARVKVENKSLHDTLQSTGSQPVAFDIMLTDGQQLTEKFKIEDNFQSDQIFIQADTVEDQTDNKQSELVEQHSHDRPQFITNESLIYENL